MKVKNEMKTEVCFRDITVYRKIGGYKVWSQEVDCRKWDIIVYWRWHDVSNQW